MKIVEPSVELLAISSQPAQLIERSARTCYKSEDKITNDSANKFVKMIMQRGHESVIEHASATFRIVTDRGISHEIVRHRLASYSQECVTGDTVVASFKLKGAGVKRWTIKQLAEWSCERKSRIPLINMRSVACDGTLVPNRIVNVVSKGSAEVFEIKTSLGYVVKVTENHEFLGFGGHYMLLRDLNAGESVMVNGRPSLLKIDDRLLSDDFLARGMTPQEIASKHGAPYRAVLRRLKILGVFEKYRNDKNKEKYIKNHTSSSFQKVRKTVLDQCVFEHDDPRVAYYAGLKTEKCCELCGGAAEHTHHIDENRRNNDAENLARVCINCHRKLHCGWHVGRRVHPDKIISIKSVGVEDVYDLEMAAPNHNYIANGFVVHNSTRYCDYGKDKFGKEISVVQPSGLDEEEANLWRGACKSAEASYFAMLANGAKPQQARSVLPTCLKTEIVMTCNFREWSHFIKLRLVATAHPDIRPIAYAIWKMLNGACPAVFDRFRGHAANYEAEVQT